MDCYSCKREADPPCPTHRLWEAAQRVHALFPETVRSGDWSVEPFDMTEREVQWAHIRGAFSGHGRETYDLVAGHYVRLTWGHTIVMSTTPMELRTHREAVEAAKGHVLIGGLGLGIIARAVRKLARVQSVTVIERSVDVLSLICPTLPSDIAVVEGDVYKWTPQDKKARFDFVWLDVWSNVPNGDDWAAMIELRRRFRRWSPAARSIKCWREWDARRDR